MQRWLAKSFRDKGRLEHPLCLAKSHQWETLPQSGLVQQTLITLIT